MKVLLVLFGFVVFFATPASAGPYGTIVHADGSMTAIYHSKTVGRSYVAQFDKNGNMRGACVRESRAAYQARKAYMKAKSNWRAGYVPRKFPCM